MNPRSGGQFVPTIPSASGSPGGLDHLSVAFCEEIATIDRDFLRRGPLGSRIDAPLMEAVMRAIRRAIGEVVPEP
jgi:hypothetical protein